MLRLNVVQALFQTVLEPVVRRELQMPFYRSYGLRNAIGRILIRDVAKIGSIVDVCIRVAIAGDIERIECVKAEADGLFAKCSKVLERRHVYIQISRAACVAISCRTESVRCRHAEGADSVVDAWRRTW